MHHLRWVTFLLAFFCSCEASSQLHTFFVSPVASFESYRALGLDPGAGFGVSLGSNVSQSLAFSASLLFGSRTRSFQALGAPDQIRVRIVSIEAGVEHLLIGEPGGICGSLVAGGGAVSSSTDGRTVSLGALGTMEIPARSHTDGFLAAGVRGMLPFGSSIALTIAPVVRFFTPFASSPADLSISGGLRVGLL